MPLVAAVCMLCSCASHPSKPEPESAATPLELRLSTRMAAESAATVEPDDKAATAADDAPRAPVSASGHETPVPQADSNTPVDTPADHRSEGHTSEPQSLMRISYAVFCVKNKVKKIARAPA